MKILIVRHADPDYSIDSLTHQGKKEAELLSQRLFKLNIKEFYVSPLGRAKATAAYTLNKLNRPAVECEWLKEFPCVINRPDKDNIIASRIVFDESMDSEKTKLIELMRTKIDRFTGGACDTGLFASKIAVGGKHTLNIMIKNAEKYEIALILLVIKDIENGLLAIGGETNVGRGIFEIDKQVNIDGVELNGDKFNEYIQYLAKKLCL